MNFFYYLKPNWSLQISKVHAALSSIHRCDVSINMRIRYASIPKATSSARITGGSQRLILALPLRYINVLAYQKAGRLFKQDNPAGLRNGTPQLCACPAHLQPYRLRNISMNFEKGMHSLKGRI